MNIITMKLKDLKPYKNNPRKNDAAVAFVKRSIQEFGYLVPKKRGKFMAKTKDDCGGIKMPTLKRPATTKKPAAKKVAKKR